MISSKCTSVRKIFQDLYPKNQVSIHTKTDMVTEHPTIFRTGDWKGDPFTFCSLLCIILSYILYNLFFKANKKKVVNYQVPLGEQTR